MTSADEKSLALRKWIFAGLMVAAGVLLSPMFSFPLGVTKAFPLQHMINIFWRSSAARAMAPQPPSAPPSFAIS